MSERDSSEQRAGWRERVLGGGVEPDPRFSLANERTFLAWIRTSLGLLAGGVAVEALTQQIFEPQIRTILAVVLLVLGALLAAGAFTRWLRVERSMRHQRPLPLPLIAPLLAAGAALISVVLVITLVGG
ncbi:MAG: YidH family protein [Nesterenkonia sp.]